MVVLVGCILVASVAVFLGPPLHGVDGSIMKPGRMGDGAYLEDVAKGTMLMMTADEKKEMKMAEKREAAAKKKQGGKFVAEIAELPDSVDCFGFPSWLVSPIKKFFAPQSRSVVGTHFILATRANRSRLEVPSGEEFSLSAMPGFDNRHRTVVIVHGFYSGGNEEWIVDMTNAILDQIDANVFAVDWSGGGGSWKYWKAVANTRVAGNDVTKFMAQLINEAGLRTEDLHLVGHSLGAHICGFTARALKNVYRVTGLDPAQPCFNTNDTSMALDLTDATFVDVIHTNGRMLSKLGFGLPHNIGHADFYPHGGMVQPECRLERRKLSWKCYLWRLFSPTTYKIYKKISETICSHGRAHGLFTASVRKAPACFFWGHPWDMHAATVPTSLQRPCDPRHCSEMGFTSDLYPARGGFFVKATNAPPYCVSDPSTDAEMDANRR